MVKTVLMSIRPKFSHRIFEGDKRFELRRTPIRLGAGDVVVVYVSAPIKAIMGAFTVSDVHRGSVERLWNALGRQFGVSDEEYREYFDGAEMAHAIEVDKVVKVKPVPLVLLRERIDGFRPPQSYMFWREELDRLVGGAAAQAIAAS